MMSMIRIEEDCMEWRIKPPNLAAIIFALCETIAQGLVGIVQAMFDVLLLRRTKL